MEFIKNFPLFCIILSFIGVVICSLAPKKIGRFITIGVNLSVSILNVFLLVLTYKNGSYHYAMGHFPAPFSNEIRFGVLEAFLGILFPIIIILSLLGGIKRSEEDIKEEKHKYLYILLNLVTVAVISLIYTNDIFTGYVFLEISTLSSVGLIFIKEKGNTIIASIRYLIFNLIGSGLFLIGCVLLYDLTGYLSMEYILNSMNELCLKGTYIPIITCTFALISIGLGIKSGLFPFYFWMPDTYGEATTTSSCIVSGIISKGYIILLIKFIYRAFGWNNLSNTNMLKIIFILGILGVILGSISAINQKKINRMVAFSSAAQIGYIYMGIGLGEMMMKAVFFQIICHAITKPLLFVSTSELINCSEGNQDFESIKGAGKRNLIAGIGFSIGALSMVGFPITGGFVMKYLFIQSSIVNELPLIESILLFSALVISTLLNTIYFIRTMIIIFLPDEEENTKNYSLKCNLYSLISISLFVVLNIMFGTLPSLIKIIEIGLSMMI